MKNFKLVLFLVTAFLLLIPALAGAVMIPLEITKKWDAVTVGPDTDWFASDLTHSSPSERIGEAARWTFPVKHTFQFTCPVATIINIQLKFNAITKVVTLNSGNEQGATNGHNYDLIVPVGASYNIQHKTGTQACGLFVIESYNTDL